MKNLNRYVTRRYATDWYDIGIELGLDLDVLGIIKYDNPQQAVTCFQKTLHTWLKLNTDDATWKTLEVALTNVNRAKLGLDPVDDVYGKDVYYNNHFTHMYVSLDRFVYYLVAAMVKMYTYSYICDCLCKNCP